MGENWLEKILGPVLDKVIDKTELRQSLKDLLKEGLHQAVRSKSNDVADEAKRIFVPVGLLNDASLPTLEDIKRLIDLRLDNVLGIDEAEREFLLRGSRKIAKDAFYLPSVRNEAQLYREMYDAVEAYTFKLGDGNVPVWLNRVRDLIAKQRDVAVTAPSPTVAVDPVPVPPTDQPAAQKYLTRDDLVREAKRSLERKQDYDDRVRIRAALQALDTANRLPADPANVTAQKYFGREDLLVQVARTLRGGKLKQDERKRLEAAQVALNITIPLPVNAKTYPDHKELMDVLNDALVQAAEGKGVQRHGGKPWVEQRMFRIEEAVDGGFLVGQALKKLEESQDMSPYAAYAETLGAIVYASAYAHVCRAKIEAKAPEPDENFDEDDL